MISCFAQLRRQLWNFCHITTSVALSLDGRPKATCKLYFHVNDHSVKKTDTRTKHQPDKHNEFASLSKATAQF